MHIRMLALSAGLLICLAVTAGTTTPNADAPTPSAVTARCAKPPNDLDPQTDYGAWERGLNERIDACIKLLDRASPDADVYYYAGRLELMATYPEKAKRLFQKGSEAGSTKAMTALGYFLGVREGDLNAMIKWYRRAAEGGDAVALTSLGITYWGVHPIWSKAVTPDRNRAERLLRKAVSQGDPLAQYALGMLLWPDGAEAGSALVVEAAEYVRMAAAAGLPDARETLRERGYEVPAMPASPEPMATMFGRNRIMMRP